MGLDLGEVAVSTILVVPGSEDDKNSHWAYDYYACGINKIWS